MKRYLRGTHRVRSPAATLDWLAPKLATMGITRVADVTGLDTLGIPVVMATRPNSRSLAVSQGKGLDLASARVSAIMESAETWHAERCLLPLLLADECELRDSGFTVVDTAALPHSRERCYSDTQRIPWVEGVDLVSGRACRVPWECVHTDYRLPRPTGSGFFAANTNGLASGNTSDEAIVHALCELIERDADTLWQHRHSDERVGIDPDSVTDPDCRELLRRIDAAGLAVRLWNITSDIGVPCFHCLLGSDDAHDTDPEFGSGCHPDPAVALNRALTEAAQARTTYIAGSRDDIGPDAYLDEARQARRADCHALMHASLSLMDFTQQSTSASDSVDGDRQWLLGCLQRVGIERVIHVDLSSAALGIPVSRLIVPGLEGVRDSADSDYVPGQRVAELLTSQRPPPRGASRAVRA